MWQDEHSVVAGVSAGAIRALFEDVAGWPEWNAGTEWVQLDGPFVAGTTGRMKIPDQEPLAFRLTYVGPVIGPQISADFPSVLAALVERAAATSSAA